MNRRGSGILLHVTSLPSPHGIGDLGPGAYRFVDFLAESKQRYWQILPLNPIDADLSSPYHSVSAFAGNPLLISPELLAEDGLLSLNTLESPPKFSAEKVFYPAVWKYKEKLLEEAFDSFQEKGADEEYRNFCVEQAHWLENFALFKALKTKFKGQLWSDWPPEIREREEEALRTVSVDLSGWIQREKFLQFIFYRQWHALKMYCRQKGIEIIGDIPIYINYDSADMWVHPELFKLDEQRKPSVVAGVPPDYFSSTGQLWGNPIYRWEVMKEDRYSWWTERIGHNLKLFDWVRIDHFRGLVAFWEVPADEETAMTGQWVTAPAMNFFNQLVQEFPHLPLIAEDLGTITPDVQEVIKHFGFPGMKVLLFAFGADLPTNPYIPHNLPPNCIAYTGTHDNNTIRGWFQEEISSEDRQRIFRYLGREVSPEELPRELIRLLMRSAANTVMVPMQDLLGLGGEARMNRPATRQGNWDWRLKPDGLTSEVAADLREMTEIYGRAV